MTESLGLTFEKVDWKGEPKISERRDRDCLDLWTAVVGPITYDCKASLNGFLVDVSVSGHEILIVERFIRIDRRFAFNEG